MTGTEPHPDRVAVGVDFSAPSVAAARWVAQWLPEGAEIVLVHALVVPELGGFLATRYPVPDSLLENAKAGAERRLRELSSTLAFPRVWIQVREGRPSDAIATVAREFGAMLVVVGKHGEGGRERGYPGRTADDLVRSSPVPVLLANPVTTKPRKILVALTFSSITRFILDWARRMSEIFDAEVHAVHVVGSSTLGHVLSMAAIERDNKPLSSEELAGVFSDETEGWKKRLIEVGIPPARVSSAVVFGEVSNEILAVAEERGSDLIVMGSHAGPIRRALLGSSATAVLRRAETPVLVVVEPEDEIAPQPEPEPARAAE